MLKRTTDQERSQRSNDRRRICSPDNYGQKSATPRSHSRLILLPLASSGTCSRPCAMVAFALAPTTPVAWTLRVSTRRCATDRGRRTGNLGFFCALRAARPGYTRTGSADEAPGHYWALSLCTKSHVCWGDVDNSWAGPTSR